MINIMRELYKETVWQFGMGKIHFFFDLVYLNNYFIKYFFFSYCRICIGLDYKINFRPEKGDKIDDLHERVAQRILRVCKFNG